MGLDREPTATTLTPVTQIVSGDTGGGHFYIERARESVMVVECAILVNEIRFHEPQHSP